MVGCYFGALVEQAVIQGSGSLQRKRLVPVDITPFVNVNNAHVLTVGCPDEHPGCVIYDCECGLFVIHLVARR